MNQFEWALGLLKKLDRARLLKESDVADIETASGEDLLRIFRVLAKLAITSPDRFAAAFAALKSNVAPIGTSADIDKSEATNALKKEAAEHKQKTGEPHPWAEEDPASELIRQAGLVSGIDLQSATDKEIAIVWPFIVGKLESRYQAILADYSESRPPKQWARIFSVTDKTWQRWAGDTVRVIAESTKAQRVHLMDLPEKFKTRLERDKKFS